MCKLCIGHFILSLLSSFIEVHLDHPSSPAACHHCVFPALVSLWTLSHLHHDAEVFDVIFLRLNELIENEPEQKEGGDTDVEAVNAGRWCSSGNTHILPLMALALCSSSGFRGWTGVVCSGGEREVKPGYAPGSRVCREKMRSKIAHLLHHKGEKQRYSNAPNGFITINFRIIKN